MSKCKYAGCMKALDNYGMEFDYLQCMAQTDEIDYKYYGDDYECGFNDDYEDCPIYRLKNKFEQLQQENQQLKNDNAVMKAGLIQVSNKQLELYKEVIKEVRELIKEHNKNAGKLYYKYNNRYLLLYL